MVPVAGALPLLTLLTLVFALNPVGLAVVTCRDARLKDQRLHETTAEMLTVQLLRSTGQNSYYLTQLQQLARTPFPSPLLRLRRATPRRRCHHLLGERTTYVLRRSQTDQASTHCRRYGVES